MISGSLELKPDRIGVRPSRDHPRRPPGRAIAPLELDRAGGSLNEVDEQGAWGRRRTNHDTRLGVGAGVGLAVHSSYDRRVADCPRTDEMELVGLIRDCAAAARDGVGPAVVRSRPRDNRRPDIE